MTNVINLRQARKRKAREEKSKQAETNRKLHGVSSKLKKLAKTNKNNAEIKLDGKKRGNHD